MKCERIPLGAQGAYLDTYFLADSPELKAGAGTRQGGAHSSGGATNASRPV